MACMNVASGDTPLASSVAFVQQLPLTSFLYSALWGTSQVLGPTYPTKCSITLRSREFRGQVNMLNSPNQNWTILAMWQSALSCWKMPLPFWGNCFHEMEYWSVAMFRWVILQSKIHPKLGKTHGFPAEPCPKHRSFVPSCLVITIWLLSDLVAWTSDMPV